MRGDGDIVLVSCYEPGHQPMGLASPIAFLRAAGYRPRCVDLAVDGLDEGAMALVRGARLVAVSVPMHTALALGTRLAVRVLAANPKAHLCFYGLYAPLNAAYLRSLGAHSIVGPECEEELVAIADAVREERAPPAPPARLRRLPFRTPERDALPPLHRYARLVVGNERRVAGHVEASRGCLHSCRHCPIPPVYRGRFFAVPAAIVLDDVDRQVAAGARHITFGDPDFLNGPRHALALARELHARHPTVSFDFTAKVEHLLARRALLPELASLGCAFIVTAFESLSDEVLRVFDKGHSARDAVEALRIVRAASISLRPTWVPFTPWSGLDDYLALGRFIADHDLGHEVDPVQMSIRLLVPPGSLLLERPEMQAVVGPLDQAALSYRWTHPDPRMDSLCTEVRALCEEAAARCEEAPTTFARIFAHAARVAGEERAGPLRFQPRRPPQAHLSERWFCCAEPTRQQVGGVTSLP